MKKTVLFLFIALFAGLTACDKTEQPNIVLYPSTANYEINGANYTAKQGIVRSLNGEPHVSFAYVENQASRIIFTLQNEQHTLIFSLCKPTGTFLAVGDELALSHSDHYENGIIESNNKTSFVVFRDGTAPNSYRSLPMLINSEGKVSYFKVTRNDDQYFEGTFEFVYGEPAVLKKNADGTSTIVKAATPKQIIRNGKISIRKQRI
ncbi:MAG: hypothetical protein ACOVQA_08980 [Thermoflexibacteraceae bacterium]|jgi:hypothetical protein